MFYDFCLIFFVRFWFDLFFIFFFFNDTATTEIYTLSLHDALPISLRSHPCRGRSCEWRPVDVGERSEEHTSELQSHHDLVCRLLLEKKKIPLIFIYLSNTINDSQNKDKSMNQT